MLERTVVSRAGGTTVLKLKRLWEAHWVVISHHVVNQIVRRLVSLTIHASIGKLLEHESTHRVHQAETRPWHVPIYVVIPYVIIVSASLLIHRLKWGHLLVDVVTGLVRS